MHSAASMLTTTDHPRRSRFTALLVGATLLGLATSLVSAPQALAAPREDRVVPADAYTSEKARALARTHASALRQLNAFIYHCIPWVEVQKESIGFFKPKNASRDERYLSVRLFIEQEPSPQFASMGMQERASSMFSRYVGPVLRRMTSPPGLLGDAALDGFTVILEWLKHAPQSASARPVHETIAIFLEKPAVVDYVAGRVPTRELATKARVLAWDGQTALGALRVSAWDDNFVSTFKIKNYQLEPGVTCQ